MGGGFLVLNPSPEKSKETAPREPSKDVYFEISPVHKQSREKETKEEDIPVLRLTQFNHPPKIFFETVKLGTTRHRKLLISNPKNDVQELYCEKPPSEDNGFTCSLYRAVIQPAETIDLVLTWTPNREGSVREVLHWKTNLGVRSQLVVMGTCVHPEYKKKGKGRRKSQSKIVGRRPVASGKGGHHGKVPSETTSTSIKSFKENLPCKSTSLKARNVVDSKLSKTNSIKEKEIKHSSQVLREANRRENFKSNCVKALPMNSAQKLKVSESSVTSDEDPLYIQKTHKEEFSRSEDVLMSEQIDFCHMTNISGQGTCIVEENEDVVTEVKECEYYVTNHGKTYSSYPVQVMKSTEISYSKMVSEKEEFYTMCDGSRTHDVAPSPLRRQTFITKSFVDDNLSHCEEVQGCEDGQLTIEHLNHETPPKFKEIFCEYMSGGSLNKAKTTPESRKTFVKAAHKCDGNTEKLVEGNTVSPQHRHQNLATGKEMFHDIHKGYLPPCHFENSPSRRQTYIKGVASKSQVTQHSGNAYQELPYLDNNQYQSSNASTPCEYRTPAQKNVILAQDFTPITPVPSEYFDNIKAKIIDLLEREDDVDPDSVLEQVEVLQKCNTPELDMHTAPVSPSSNFETAPSTPTDEQPQVLSEVNVVPPSSKDGLQLEQGLTLDNISMLVEIEMKSENSMNKNGSIKFEEEALHKERCLQAKNNLRMKMLSPDILAEEMSILHSDEICIDEKCRSNEKIINDQQRTVTLDDISMLVEMEMKSEDNVNKCRSDFEKELCGKRCLQHKGYETGSSNTVVKEASTLNPDKIRQSDRLYGSCKVLVKNQPEIMTLDDLSLLIEKELKSEDNVDEEGLCKQISLQGDEIRRLSSETVVKDMSVLHPDEIVYIDKCGSNETLVKDQPSLSPSMLHHVTDTYTPRRKSTHGFISNSELRFMSTRQSLPLIHCNEDYQSKTLNELLLYKNTKGKDLDENVEDSKFTSEECNGINNLVEGSDEPDNGNLSLEKESFMLASETDFNFSPDANSRRCSTCIKADPPEDVDPRNVVLEKCRTLFSDLDKDQSLTPKISDSDMSDIYFKGLSTIEETEEDLSFALCTKSEGSRKINRTSNTLTKNNSFHCENSGDQIDNTFETKPIGLTFIKPESSLQSGKEAEITKNFKKKGISLFAVESTNCKLLKKTASEMICDQHVSHSKVGEDNRGRMEEPSAVRVHKDKSVGVFFEISPPRKSSLSIKDSLDLKTLMTDSEKDNTHVCQSEVKDDNTGKFERPFIVRVDKAEDKSVGALLEIIPPRKFSDIQKAKTTQTTGLKSIDNSSVKFSIEDNKSSWSKRSHVNPTPASKFTVPFHKTTQGKSGNKQPTVLSTKCKSPVKKRSSRAGIVKPVTNFKIPEDKVGKFRDQTQKQRAKKQQFDSSRNYSSNPQLGSTISSTSLNSNRKNTFSSTCSLTNSTNSLSSLNSSTSSKCSSIGGKKSTGLRVPQAKLTLIKMQKTMIVHHPNPYIARNMFYDDRWIEKQVAGFTKWLNFILTPPEEEMVSVDASKTGVRRVWNEASRSSQIVLAPSKETLSLRAYTARRKINQLRRKACLLYQSVKCVEFIGKLETAIGKKYLIIRKDRHTHADIGLKQQLLQLVLCYNPLWLRIGLETVYGELVQLESNNDITGLTYFIVNRLVNNPDIQSKFAHPSVPHSYRNGYEDALKAFQLKKFLLLIYFLELAKINRLIHHDPCLFNKNAPHKSSRDILVAFAAEFLSGVGDITKHLAYLGYDVKHKQTLLDEFDYAVSNLAVDLRCGIRLTRVIEMLTMDTNYSKKLRVPAVSRTQKVHNIEVAFSAISASGIQDIATHYSAKDIVDGHQEQTLELLWTIMYKLQLQTILKEETLMEEISYLRRSLKVRAEFGGEAKSGLMNIRESLKEFDETLEKPKSEDYLLILLKAWTMLICAHYAVQVENLSVSFSDGRALCLLLHHYHAEILPRDFIRWETTQNMHVQGIDLDMSQDDSFSDMTYIDTKEEFQKRLANEKDNFILLREKVSQLGGVPPLIRGSDMVNTIPDERVTSLFLAYLCTRLLDLSTEIKAVRVIQVAWRKRMAKRRQRDLEIWSSAACFIQRWWRRVLHCRRKYQYDNAAVILQSHWRRRQCQIQLKHLRYQEELKHKNLAASIIQAAFCKFLVRKTQQKIKAASVIQNSFRTWQQRKNFYKQQKAVVILQSFARMVVTRRRYVKQVGTLVGIQKRYRAKLQERKAGNELNERTNAVVRIQRWFRMILAMREAKKEVMLQRAACIIAGFFKMCIARNQFLQMQKAAVIIQSQIRMIQQRDQFDATMRAVMVLQDRWRATLMMRSIREQYLQLKEVVIFLQSNIRAYIEKKKFHLFRRSAIIIQAQFRGWRERQKFLRKRESVKVIQEFWCNYQQARSIRKEFMLKKRAAVTIQSMYRCYVARKKYQQLWSAVVIIQSYFKMVLHRKKYNRKLKAVKTLQIHLKARKAMKQQRTKFQMWKTSVVKIQTVWRGFHVRQGYRQLKQASVLLQSRVRGWSAKKRYNNLRAATLTIQCKYRAKLAMGREKKKYQQLRSNTIHLQALLRGHFARKRYKEVQSKIIKTQAHVRRWIQCRQYQKQLKAVAIIQEWYRATLFMKKQRVDYRLERKASIVIQSYVRMYLHRKEYIRKLEAIRTLQMYVRAQNTMRDQQRTYKIWKASAVKIQTAWRVFHARKEYKRMQKATIVMQSAVRSWCAKKNYKSLRSAALVIQARYRRKKVMEWERKKFLQLRDKTICLQSLVRGWMQRKQCQRHLKAAIVIQSWYKATRVMKEQMQLYRQKKRAAVVIQSQIRMFIQWRIYIKKRKAIKTLQTCFRYWKVMKKEQKKYQLWKVSVVKIQAMWRGFCVRQHYRQQQQASIVLQSAVRGWYVRRQCKKLKTAALIVESRYQAKSLMKRDRNEFLQLRANVVHLQALIRGYLARQRLKADYAKVIKAQTCIRGWIQRKQYQKQVKAAVAIQRWIRTTQTMKELKVQYQEMKWAVVFIQANARRLITRSWYLKQRQAAIVLQKYVRGMFVRSWYFKLQQKVCVIQNYVRAWLLGRKVCQEFIEMKMAAVIIQAHYRVHKERIMLKKKSEASTTIQSWYRMIMQQQNYVKKRKAALVIQGHYRAYMEASKTRQYYLLEKSSSISIQSFWRMYVARKRYTVERVAIITIQQHVRACLARRKMQEKYLLERKACIKAQTWVRMFLAKNRYLTMKTAVLKIQEYYIAFKAGQATRKIYQKQREAAIIIQSWYRMTKQKYHFKEMKYGVYVIQEYVQGYLQMKKLRNEYLKKRQAVILIQSKVRGWLQLRNYVQIKLAAIRIQTWYRTQRAVETYKRIKWAVATLQKRYRLHRVLLNTREEYKAIQSAVLNLQAFARGMIVRKQLEQKKESAVVIQKYYRMWKTRTWFICKREAAKKIQLVWRSVKETRMQREVFFRNRLKIVTLQSYIRGFLVRRSLTEKHKTVTVLQAAIKGWQAKRRYRKKLEAVVKLQEYWRGACLTLQCREDFIYRRRAAVILQTAWRRHLARREFQKHKAARVIQAYIRGWQVRQAVKNEKRQENLCKVAKVIHYHAAAITIQAKERKAVTCIQAAWRGYKVRKHMDKRLSHVNERLEKAANKVTESNTIGNRTESAIMFLLKYRDLKHVLMAVMTLDASTRLSTVCCKKLVDGACLGVLNFFLCSANRSLPHIEILSYIVNILINLMKCPYSALYVLEMENIVEVLIRLMNLHHEKGPSLFNKCATLLYLFAISPHPHQDLASLSIDSLRKLHTMMVRKETARLRGKRQAKIDMTKYQTPCLVPEWSMKPGQVREFEYPIPAITLLLQKLTSLSVFSIGKQ